MKKYLLHPPEEEGWAMTRWKIAHFMNHWTVKCFIVVAIVSNAVTIGLEADYGDGTGVWFAIEMLFLSIFCIELTLNLVGFGMLFWEDTWNWLDAGIIVTSLIDFVIYLVVGDGAGFLSVVRLVRILRIIRVISFLEKMVYLVSAFIKGLENVFWVLVLWTISLYIFAVMAKGFFGDSDYLKEQLAGGPEGLDMDQLFGTIPRAMVTCIGLYTYDNSIALQRAIGEVFPWAWIYFLIFMVIVSIGVMELMTSLFIDSLLEEKRRVESKHKQEKEKRRHEVQALIKGLFEAFDEDQSQTLDKKELRDCLSVFDDPEMRSLLEYVEIDSQMMQAAIKVADIDGDEEVSAEEFSAALESIHEAPKKSDIREVHQRVGHLQRDVGSILERQHAQEEEMQSVTARLIRMEALLQRIAGVEPVNAGGKGGSTLPPIAQGGLPPIGDPPLLPSLSVKATSPLPPTTTFNATSPSSGPLPPSLRGQGAAASTALASASSSTADAVPVAPPPPLPGRGKPKDEQPASSVDEAPHSDDHM